MSEDKQRQLVFGPVPSRRLGRSLGVDLIPYKTCSYNCMYCQLGSTTDLTIVRRDSVDPAEIIAQVREKLVSGPAPDYITVSGSGEPTLCSRLGEVIEGLRGLSDVPVALLTNGSLLWMPEVRADAARANLVIPTLAAVSEDMLRRIHRPDPALTLATIVSGLEQFRREYPGNIWLEVFVIAEVNDKPHHMELLARFVQRIRPDKVQLNTAVRPTADKDAVAVPKKHLERLAAMFDPPAEVIADYEGVHRQSDFTARREDVLAMVRRRPCSMPDIAGGLGIHLNEATKYVGELLEEELIAPEDRDGTVYYTHRAR